MKILLINTVPLEANGISTFIINSAKVMSNKGIDVTVLAPNIVNNQLKLDLRKAGVSVIEIPNRQHNPINYYLKLRHKLASTDYDVVHVNGNSTTMAIELIAAMKANIPLRIAHSHNTTTEHPIVNKMLRPMFEKSVNGRLACNVAAGQWLFNNKKYTIIKNGIFLNNYVFNTDIRKEIRNRYHISNNEILIGHVGMFNFQKNQIFLIKLLKKLSPKYRLMLIGDGPDLLTVKQRAIKAGIKDRIIFTGTVNNVSDYLNAMDLFTLPSNFEGQPFVVIEALASGLPVIVSKNVSKEINLTNSVKFISLKNISEWKSRVSIVRTDNKSRKKISLNNINLLKEKGYDTERNVMQVLIPFYRRHLN